MDKISVRQIRKDEIVICESCPLRLRTAGNVYFSLNGKLLCFSCAEPYLKAHSGEEHVTKGEN